MIGSLPTQEPQKGMAMSRIWFGPGVLIVALLAYLLPMGAYGASAARLTAAAPRSVYGDTLATGWNNWSWGTNTDFLSRTAVHTGARALSVTYTAGWSGLQLGRFETLDVAAYD